jgi:hypothetical protein
MTARGGFPSPVIGSPHSQHFGYRFYEYAP